jgi:ubiquinone/menaquinone biosynthesis C-methylase UbiE
MRRRAFEQGEACGRTPGDKVPEGGFGMEQRTALIEGYSRSAPMYDQTAGMTYLGALWKLLPRVRARQQPSILDVGCGTGINLLEAARTLGPAARLVGVDLAPGMVEEARKKASFAGVPATFVVGDAEHLQLEDAAFDLVICNSVYHWFPNRQRAVAELSRVLRPGGQLLLNCVADPGFAEWIRVVDAVWAKLFNEPRSWVPPLPTPGELMGHVRAAGLVLEHLEYEVDPMPVMDVAGFLRTMTVIAPTWITGVPASGARAMMGAMTDALGAGAEGPFVVTAAGVATVSRKAIGRA